ncbi:MAG: substrate-binding domain-containing protein [Butyricicoccus sp.]
MVTMQQIADRCGVSRGTVDRALHHKEGVREEVAERIRATAREMGYISNRLVMQQTRQWKIGVVLHSSHSMFVRMLCDLFASFSERELIPNVTVIVRSMYDMDIQHQLTLIDELVTSEHIDGLALMPLANTLVRDRINDLSEKMGIPVVTFNTDIADANRIAYVGPDNIAAGRAAAALMGMVMQGHGSVLPILGQRSGLCGFAALHRFWAEMAENFLISAFCIRMFVSG